MKSTVLPTSVGNVEVVVDELPTGDFLEIEGPDSDSIRAAAMQLGLNWEAGITGELYSTV